MELIWTIDFKFGAQSKQHIPSKQMQDFINGEEQHSTQIASSHVGNYKEMKEGNYFIHIGIDFSNFPCFKFCIHIDLLSFEIISFKKVPLSYTTLNFIIVWVCLNC
jgi:hypothetical protein